MAITSGAISPTQSNPYAAIAGGTSAPGAGMPSINLPSIQTGGVDPNSLSTSSNQVYSLLAKAPQSLTQAIGPLLQQVFGAQANLMQPIFQQQGAQGAAQAQSDAMKRGLTGSSIESASMGQAYASANQGYDQYLANQLSSLVPAYTQAAGTDITNQQSYYSNLAQAVGQQLSSQISQQQFQQQLQAGMAEAKMSANSQMWGGIAGGVGSALGGALMHYSDVRLKKTLFPVLKWKNLTMYLFEYNDKIKDLPKGPRVGFLAHEVAKHRPDCVAIDKEGYLMVDYPKLMGLKLKPLVVA
jgi:hypothetical protein